MGWGWRGGTAREKTRCRMLSVVEVRGSGKDCGAQLKIEETGYKLVRAEMRIEEVNEVVNRIGGSGCGVFGGDRDEEAFDERL